MQPSNTAAIQRYNAILEFNGTAWVLLTELFNNIGTMVISGTSNVAVQNAAGGFKEDKTFVLAMGYKASAYNFWGLSAINTTAIQLNWASGTPAEGERVYVQIEVFNN